MNRSEESSPHGVRGFTRWSRGLPAIVFAIQGLAAVLLADAPSVSEEPAAPQASSEVQLVVEESERLLLERQYDEALGIADRALGRARGAADPVGETLALRARARALTALGRTDESLAAWREAENGWQAQGALPERIEAIGAQALLALRAGDVDAVERSVGRMVRFAAEGTDRPTALVGRLNTISERLRKNGSLPSAEELARTALGIAEERTPESLGVATSLYGLAVVARSQGDPEAAREYHRRALEFLERHAPGSLDIATNLNGLGLLARSQNDLAAAREHYRRALEIREVVAPGSLIVAESLSNVGGVALDQGDLTAAKEYYRRALEIRERHAPGSLDVAASLNGLGGVAHHQGDLRTAREYLERALELREKHAPGSIGVAGNLNNLGVVARGQGDLVGAREYYRRALEIRERHAPGSLDVAASLGSLGNVALDQGDPEAALEYHRRALELREKHAPGSLAVAINLDSLGKVALDLGELDSARDYLRRALEIQEEHAPGSLAVAWSLSGLGRVARGQGDLEAAREYFQRGLELQEQRAPGSPDIAASLNGLGHVAVGRGDLEAARDYHRRALEIQEEHAPGSLGVARSLSGLGVVARGQGDLEAAREYFLRSLEIREMHAPESLDVAWSLSGLYLVARGLGEFEAARGYQLRALEIRERHAPASLEVAWSWSGLGVVARDQGDLASAQDCFARAWSIVRHQGRAVAGDEAWLAFSEGHAYYAARLIEAEIRLGEPQRAMTTLEESRAQGLLELFDRRGLGRAADPESWSAYRRAERARDHAGEELAETATRVALLEREVADLMVQGMVGEALATKETELASARAEGETALAEHTRARLEMSARLAEVKRTVPGLEPEAFTLESAREALPAGALLIAFSVGEKSTSVLLVPADPERALHGYVVDLGASPLDERVRAIRAELARGGVERGLGLADAEPVPEGTRPLREAGRALFDALLPTEAHALIDGAERIVISPDGPLLALPFAALDAGSGDETRWWGIEKPISYAPSLSTLVVAKRRAATPSAERTVLVLGDPSLRIAEVTEKGEARAVVTPAEGEVAGATTAEAGALTEPVAAAPALPLSSPGRLSRSERTLLFPGDEPPPPLPGAREEAERLGALYGVDPLLGVAATEAAVRARLPGAAIVHFATHGLFHPTQPMSSGLLLAPSAGAGAEATATDGALQAWEFLAEIELQADLVVLSACETGLGRAVRGEGLVGLTRSLQAAGARSVLATHWKVEDRSAADLMVTFHEKLRAGLAKDAALHAAMREVAARPETSHPYFWAAYFLSGEAR